MDVHKMFGGEKAWWELHKDSTCCFEQILEAVPPKNSFCFIVIFTLHFSIIYNFRAIILLDLQPFYLTMSLLEEGSTLFSGVIHLLLIFVLLVVVKSYNFLNLDLIF